MHERWLVGVDVGGTKIAVVVGSDAVWNFRHPWYAGRSIFFGEGLNTRRLVS